jgi:hypothetical protein
MKKKLTVVLVAFVAVVVGFPLVIVVLTLVNPTPSCRVVVIEEMTIPSEGGVGAVSVLTTAWLRVTGISRWPNGSVNFKYQPNTTGSVRKGTITIGDKSIMIYQEGEKPSS